jgi:hypothetical protein
VATAEEDRLSFRRKSVHFFFAAASDALLQRRPNSTPAPTAPAIRSGAQLFPEAGEDGRCGVVSSKKFLVSSKEFKLTEWLG